MNILFQIRAEKPYYMADPEVDSLVSTVQYSTVQYSTVQYRTADNAIFKPLEMFICSPPTRSRPVLVTEMAKNSNENAYLHRSNLKGERRRSFQ